MADEKLHNYTQHTFEKAWKDMIVKSTQSWNDLNSRFVYVKPIRDYSEEEIGKIINSGSIAAQQELSYNYFMKDGLYRRLILYYATLLTYAGLLIPNPTFGNELSTPYIKKRFENALDYVDKFFNSKLLTHFSITALINGCYYGVVREVSRTDFVLIDLPAKYCRSVLRDLHGNDIIEFNTQYFDSILEKDVLDQALKSYPKIIADHYRRYKKSQVKSPWVKIPTDIGFCFPFSDDGRPLFLDVIPAVINYDKAVDLDRERELEEIRKIIVEKVPHLQDGQLLFEPDEAAVMHSGAVGMMKGNKNISVLTTYCDVDSVVSKTSSEAASTTLEKALQNVYSRANTSAQIFAPTGSQALKTSIINDMSLMMILANKYASFLTYIINNLYANSNISFTYKILPVSLYTVSDYVTDALKLASSGYSFLLPAVGFGLSQKELVNIKHLENDVLKLGDILIPLASSYTQSSNNPVGRPALDIEDKSPKTLQNEESLDKQ